MTRMLVILFFFEMFSFGIYGQASLVYKSKWKTKLLVGRNIPVTQLLPGTEITTFEYLPLTGLTRIKDSTGKSLTYRYNRHGKLEKVLNTAGEPELRYTYSTDKN